MNFFDKWLSGLKGGPMVTWAVGVSAAQWTFLADYAPQMGIIPRSAFTGVTFLVCCGLYFINPKTRDWLPAEGRPQDLVYDMASALLAERLPQIQESIAASVRGSLSTSVPNPGTVTRVIPVPLTAPVTIPVTAPPTTPPDPNRSPGLHDPNRTLTNDEALAEVLKSLQTTAVLLQNRIHKEEGNA